MCTGIVREDIDMSYQAAVVLRGAAIGGARSLSCSMNCSSRIRLNVCVSFGCSGGFY